MKYNKVSVVKKIMLLLMTMALAVAMMACDAATPTPGEKGDTGDTGDQGPPGTTDNEKPMATMDLPMVYLALKGTGAMPSKTGIDLSKHFTDAENAALTYKPESDDKTVATVEVKAGMLSVMGKGAGTATVTVKAYDGVNTDPAMNSFDVMVVAENVKPSVLLNGDSNAGSDVDLLDVIELLALRMPLYVSLGASKAPITATIDAGEAGDFEDGVEFSFDMGKDGSDDDIVSVDITRKTGTANKWEVALSPLKPGLQNVYVTVKDKFGAAAERPVTADDTVIPEIEEVAQGFQFVAFVNTVPSLDKELPDKTILIESITGNSYTISEHFNTHEVAPTTGPKIGKMTALAPAPDPTGDAEEDAATCTATGTSSQSEVLFLWPTIDKVNVITTAAVAEETLSLTITCRDIEGFATDSATITLRKPR